MKRTAFIATATSALVAMSVVAGSAAWADSHESKSDEAELAQFLSANPAIVPHIEALEAQTGGKVTEAEFDDDMGDGTTHVELELRMADGKEQEYILNTTDGSITRDD